MNCYSLLPRSSFVVGLLLTIHIAVLERAVDAQCESGCPQGSLWTNSMPIKVKINALIDEDLCPDSTCSSFTDIRRTVEAVFNEYYHMTGGKLRFVYAGETTEPRGTIIDDHVHIFAANGCGGGTLALASWGGTWGKIRMCISNDGGPINWDTFQPGPGKISFHRVLLHELGHVIGMGHIEDCTSPPCMSIMRAYYGGAASEHLCLPDIGFVHGNYGLRANVGRPKWTFDATTWLNGGGSLSSTVSAYGRFAATNSESSGNNVFVAWTSTDNTICISKYTPSSWTVASCLGFIDDVPIYHPGVASNGNTVFLTWLSPPDIYTGKQDVLARISTDGGVSLPGPSMKISDDFTRTANAGVSATYDPESGSFIAIWCGSGADRNAIMYRVVGMSPSPLKLQNPVTGEDIKAVDTPSIACGPADVLGDDNCLVCWIDAFNWQRPVRWTQGYVSAGGQLELKSIKTHGYVTVGSASVAYWDNGTHPWLIALNQGGRTTYTWRKGPSHADDFMNEAGFSFLPKVTLPAAGSRERFTGGRGYVFVMDQ